MNIRESSSLTLHPIWASEEGDLCGWIQGRQRGWFSDTNVGWKWLEPPNLIYFRGIALHYVAFICAPPFIAMHIVFTPSSSITTLGVNFISKKINQCSIFKRIFQFNVVLPSRRVKGWVIDFKVSVFFRAFWLVSRFLIGFAHFDEFRTFE